MQSIISRKGMKCPNTDYALDLKTIFLDQQKAALCESDVYVSVASCISGPPVDLFWWKILLMLPQVRAIAVVMLALVNTTTNSNTTAANHNKNNDKDNHLHQHGYNLTVVLVYLVNIL